MHVFFIYARAVHVCIFAMELRHDFPINSPRKSREINWLTISGCYPVSQNTNIRCPDSILISELILVETYEVDPFLPFSLDPGARKTHVRSRSENTRAAQCPCDSWRSNLVTSYWWNYEQRSTTEGRPWRSATLRHLASSSPTTWSARWALATPSSVGCRPTKQEPHPDLVVAERGTLICCLAVIYKPQPESCRDSRGAWCVTDSLVFVCQQSMTGLQCSRSVCNGGGR